MALWTLDWVLVTPASQTLQSPTATFVLLLAIALLIPPVFERLKLPGLVGLIVAGVLFGGSGLGWLDHSSETMVLFSEIGKIYLMFVAGLEIDLALFQKTRNRSLTFGALTFAIPFVGGVGVGLWFGFGWLAAVLIGSLLASHTLLAYPIVQRLGVVSDEAVTVTVGATIFTDVTALVVLAICLGIGKGDFTADKLLVLLGSLALYSTAILVGLSWLAQSFFKATGQDEGNQFLFVLLSVFLAAVGAQLIGVEGIIGAFLAGLSINSVIGDGPVKEKTEFLGSVLFIPMFFIDMGLLLNLQALKSLVSFVQLPLVIVSVLLLSKLLAALATGKLFGYSRAQTWTMWSLSIPQVAATLAAALVGYEANIISSQVFNSVILLMLVTAIVGPLLTARTARRIATQNAAEEIAPLSWLPVPAAEDGSEAVAAIAPLAHPFTVVVPVYNPKTEQRLLELAAIVAGYEQGRIVPMTVALAQPQMDSPAMRQAIARSHRRLNIAEAVVSKLASQTAIPIGLPPKPTLRIEYSIPQAICHVSREENANLIVLGMGRQRKMGSQLLSRVHDDVLWGAHCPVVVARLLNSPTQFRNILFPVENPSPFTIRVLRFAQVIAAANGGRVSLVQICGSLSSTQRRIRLQTQLNQLASQLPLSGADIDIQILIRDNREGAIAKMAKQYDLVILRAQRRRISSGLSLGSSTQPLLEKLSGSVVLVGEPTANATRLRRR